jgi:1-deoxy-D-xylulose 5-phosphate reductoisomerase
LEARIGFLDIEALVADALSHFAKDIEPLDALPQIEALDTQVRDWVRERITARI